MARCIDCKHLENIYCHKKSVTMWSVFVEEDDSYCRFFEQKEKEKPMKLEVTKEKVLEAAKNCSQAKEVLKTLFPEVFKEERWVITEPGDKFKKNNITYFVALVGKDPYIYRLVNTDNNGFCWTLEDIFKREGNQVCIDNDYLKEKGFIKV
jgi:hypothetical protein